MAPDAVTASKCCKYQGSRRRVSLAHIKIRVHVFLDTQYPVLHVAASQNYHPARTSSEGLEVAMPSRGTSKGDILRRRRCGEEDAKDRAPVSVNRATNIPDTSCSAYAACFAYSLSAGKRGRIFLRDVR